MTPEQIARNGSEHSAQAALFCWSNLADVKRQYPELELMFAIPNGGERNIIVAAKLRAEGVKSSIPDIFLPVPRGPWHGLFVEMKRAKSVGKSKGYATADQKKTIEALKEQGYGAAVCEGWEQARDMILQYLNYGK